MRPDPRAIARGLRARLRAMSAPRAQTGRASPPTVLTLDEIGALPRNALEDACRALASPAYLGDGVALCRILTRYKFHVSTADVGFGANLLLDGYWESWLTQFIARTVGRGGVVVDVGANFGYYSLLLADLVGPQGRVYAIEPAPGTTALLRRSIGLNGFAGRTRVCEVAAGADDGAAATLFEPEGEPKNAALVAAAPAEDAAGRSHQVAVRTLDSLLRDERRIDFVKIDAEGGEEAIIAGMHDILSAAPPPMVLEYNAARYPDAGAFLERLLGYYGTLRHIGFDGRAAAVAPERVLGENFGEDWLLYLRRP